jgi:hypothetical protein
VLIQNYLEKETDTASGKEIISLQEKGDRKEAKCSYQVKGIGRTYGGICP